MLGFLTGAIIFGLTYQSFMPGLISMLNFGNVPLNELFNVSAGLTVAVLVVMFALVLYVVERTHAARKDKLNSEQGTD